MWSACKSFRFNQLKEVELQRTDILTVPKENTTTCGPRSRRYTTARLWNSLVPVNFSACAQGCIDRAVKKFLSSRMIMNSKQRFRTRTKGHLGTFCKLESRKWRFQRFSRGISHRWDHVISSEYTQDWKQCSRNVPGVPRHCTVRTFHRSKPRICVQCHSKLGNKCFTVIFLHKLGFLCSFRGEYIT